MPRSHRGSLPPGASVPAELFVDTSGWYTLALSSAAGHDAAQKALRERVKKRARIVTSNLVVAETHVLLLRRSGRRAALAFLREVGRGPNIVVTSSPDHEQRALTDWLERFDDQPFSFTDAVSFAIMKERGIREALATDHHFAAAGFVVVPAP